MAKTMHFPQQRAAAVDANGVLQREWSLFFLDVKQGTTDNADRIEEVSKVATLALTTANEALSEAQSAGELASNALSVAEEALGKVETALDIPYKPFAVAMAVALG